MTDSPMYRFLIFELNGTSGVLACLNHLISDAWTFSLLAKGVYNLCLEFESGCISDHENYNYADFIETEKKYLDSERCQKDEVYWTKVYLEKPEPCPIKLINKPVSIPTAQRFSTVLTAEQTEKINCYCSENNVSQAALFETAVFAYLSRVNSENNQITIGIPVLNRKTKSDKSTAGMYISTMPLTVEISAKDSAHVLSKRITDIHSQIFRHQQYPYSNILTQIRQRHQFNGNLYDVMVSFQNAKTEEEITTRWFTNGFSEVPFVLHIDNRDSASGYTLNVDYQTEVFHNAEEVKLLVDRIILIINQIIDIPEIAVGDINLIPEEEYQKVIYDFNDTAIDYPRDKCIHELFSEQAAKTPDKIALVFEDKRFTYKQLDEMSNSLAHYLREEKGIKPNDIVPIIAKRSWHVIVAMLGVLKAGGAYMPVDPAYPIDRIEYMISEVKATIALTCGFYDTTSVLALNLEKFDYSYNCTALCNVNYSDDKCYLLFTSGTTGKPKATIVNHQNLGNFVNNNNNQYQCNMLNTCHTVLALSTYTFDISVFEIYLSLLNGLTVIMSNEQENLSASQLAKLIEENDVDVIHSTPTKMLMYLEDENFQKASQRLKMMMMGAETFTEDFHDKIRRYTNAVVYNGYGPTETTIGVSFKKINGSPYVVHELFSELAARTPNKTALIFENRKFTYKQLDEMSNSLAHYLRKEKGIKPNDIVPIISKRSWHIIVAMLGVLKAGGAYTLIDFQYPKDRIEYLINLCKSEIVLTYEYKYDDGIELEIFDYEYNITSISNCNKVSDLFCAIHTSGSTGMPKLTSLTHSNIIHYINYSECFFENIDQTIATTIITFDAFIQETIVSLCNSTSIVLCSENEITNQHSFEALVKRYSKSFLFQTPTKLLSYIRNSKEKEFIKCVDCFVIGGEIFPEELYNLISDYNPNSRVYNIYGPTETTICVTTDDITDELDITIGKPIANTQIYILDKDRKPLPIGVAGELCISGDGVGKGYLNRPELTAEKFVQNPFIEGKTMYRTGDLARWRADGELEYLGRIDTQVKIRGLRIELGEIESVMSSFDGIRLTAVTDKRDENNRQYLVGYYTSETEIDEKSLRQHLSAKLPKYMIPNYFVHLVEMPMTASGKTDRKNLPLPDFTQDKSEYVAPETEAENKLCDLLALLFGIEKVGVTDDFFELGGDSLKAIEYIAKAHNIGIEINLQEVFDYPSVRELCIHLENGTESSVLYTSDDFEKYEEILSRNVLDVNSVPQKKSLGNILLTGATGFLGAHILDSFINKESGKIYCLVRDDKNKLVSTLRYYFGDKYDDEIGKRIIPVVGDITNELLSNNIPNDVQTVIHTAASVKHYGSYQYFHEVNVRGTQNVINYAKKAKAKLIHISTISVSGNSFADAFTVYRSEEEKHFDEHSLYIGQELDNVYVRSKFEAEMAVLDAVIEGLNAKIIRVGNLTNRASDFKFQPNYTQNAFLTRIKAALEFGKLPEYLMPLYAEFSPIDETAVGIIRIAQYAEEQNVFHLNSNRPIYFTRLLEVLKRLEIPMKVVGGTEFGELLQEYAKNSETAYIYEAFQNDMDENGNLVYDSNIRIINDFTVQFLKKAGFEWSQIDYAYIKGYVEYFRNLGYLEVQNEE